MSPVNPNRHTFALLGSRSGRSTGLAPLFLGWCILLAQQEAQAWVTETVDFSPLGSLGAYSSIAVDSSDGSAHISYYDNLNQNLRYATNATGTWTVETEAFDNADTDGWYTSIALDSSGKVHIGYSKTGPPPGSLRYATNASGSWAIEDVDASGAVQSTSIALDASDSVHIAYGTAGNPGDLKYATNATGAWVSETIEALTTGIPPDVSLVLDTAGHPHISYQNGGDVKYATRDGDGPWTIEEVDTTGTFFNTYRFTSLELDRAGNAHISYHDGANGNIKYATNAGQAPGVWLTEAVAPVALAGSLVYTSLALDCSGQAHISYSYREVGGGRYLRYVTNAEGDWRFQTVQTGGGFYSSIAIGPFGGIHISYEYLGRLHHAHTSFTVARVATVDAEGDVGKYTSIATDCSDGVHISYYDASNGDLKYAVNSSGTWSIATVDEGLESSDDVGQYSSIAIDSSGYAHISYYDATNEDLRYATNAGGGWQTWRIGELLARLIDVPLFNPHGLFTSIAVDSMDKVHISCYWQNVRNAPDLGDGGLLYFTNASGDWELEWTDLAAGRNTGLATALALDASDRVHIAYTDISNDSLVYATNATEDGTWRRETAFPEESDEGDEDRHASVGRHNSIAVDDLGNVHISWVIISAGSAEGNLPGAIQHSTNATGAWEHEGISFGGVPQWNSLAVDSRNDLHLSFSRVTPGALFYSTNASGSWIEERLDPDLSAPSERVGQYNSLAVDRSGAVHISYYDQGNGDLTYVNLKKYVNNEGVDGCDSSEGPANGDPPDRDGDGIVDDVDEKDCVPSDFFSDFGLGGSTNGRILDPGDQRLTILEEPNPAGVRISARGAGGPAMAFLSLCWMPFPTAYLEVGAGDEVVATCGSVTVESLAGNPVFGFDVDGETASVILESGNGLTFDPDTATVTAPPTNVGILIVRVGAREIPVAPGESKRLDGARAAFRRGDCNDDGELDISDAVCMLKRLFLGGPTPDCVAVMNTNGDGAVDIADVMYLLNYLFLSGPKPVEPFPGCGPGTLPTDGETCESPPPRCQQ